MQVYIHLKTLDDMNNDTNGQNSNDTLYDDISRYLWIVVSPILCSIGIVFGFLTVLTLKRMRFLLKNNTAMLQVFFLAVCDMVVLCVVFSRYWLMETFGFDLRTTSHFGCKLNLFTVYVFMQYSSWILVSISMERFILSNYVFIHKVHVTKKKVIVALLVILGTLVALNVHFFWTHSLVQSNQTTVQCKEKAQFEAFGNILPIIDLIVLSLLPFSLMLVLNIFIAKSLRNSRYFRRQSVPDVTSQIKLSTSDQRITRMMLFTSSYFLICTLPNSVLYIVNAALIEHSVRLKLAGTLTYLLQLSNYTVNFFIYYNFNPKFKKTVIEICCCKKFRFRRERQHTSVLRSASYSVTSSSLPTSSTDTSSSKKSLQSYNVTSGV